MRASVPPACYGCMSVVQTSAVYINLVLRTIASMQRYIDLFRHSKVRVFFVRQRAEAAVTPFSLPVNKATRECFQKLRECLEFKLECLEFKPECLEFKPGCLEFLRDAFAGRKADKVGARGGRGA